MNEHFKICVCYHRPAFLFDENYIVPMWAGKDVANTISKEGFALSEKQKEWMEKHCAGDNTGDNISNENRKYSEITVLYWVWKNYEKIGNPQYIGFMQYRRHFLLKENGLPGMYPDNRNQIYIEDIPENYAEMIGMTSKNVNNILHDFDGIAAVNDTKQSIRFYNENHFSQDVKYYNKTLEIIDKYQPEISGAAHQYERETYHAWSQCFVIKKEHFFDYCDFLFDVLQKLDAFCKDDYAKLSVEQQRILGYAAENIWGIYWRYLKNKGVHFKEVPLVFIKKPFV